MLWEDLRYVLELATSRSLPEASERLGVSRSTITRRLRDLQNEAGVTIFTRDRHRYRLTEAGLALIDDLHAVNAKIRRLEHKLQSGRRGSQGRLRIGFSNPVLTVPLMRLLAVFRERCPNVALRIHADALSLRADSEVLDLLVEHRAAGSCQRKSEQLFDFSWALYDTPHRASEDAEERSWIRWSQEHFPVQRAWLDEQIPQCSNTIDVDSLEACFLSALSGLGRTLLPCFVGDNDRALRRVGGVVSGLDTSVHLKLLIDPETSEAVRTFLEFINMASFRRGRLLEACIRRDA